MEERPTNVSDTTQSLRRTKEAISKMSSSTGSEQSMVNFLGADFFAVGFLAVCHKPANAPSQRHSKWLYLRTSRCARDNKRSEAVLVTARDITAGRQTSSGTQNSKRQAKTSEQNSRNRLQTKLRTAVFFALAFFSSAGFLASALAAGAAAGAAAAVRKVRTKRRQRY